MSERDREFQKVRSAVRQRRGRGEQQREQPRLLLPDSGAPKPRPRLEQLLWHAAVPLLDRPDPLEKVGNCRACGRLGAALLRWDAARGRAGAHQDGSQMHTRRTEVTDSRHNNKPMVEVAGAPSMPKNTVDAGPRERAILYRS